MKSKVPGDLQEMKMASRDTDEVVMLPSQFESLPADRHVPEVSQDHPINFQEWSSLGSRL